MGEKQRRIDRRGFLKATGGAAAAGFMIVKPEAVRGTRANSAVQLGVIGCGGRGTNVGTSMMKNTNLRVVALADLFQDRLEEGAKNFGQAAAEAKVPKVPAKRLFAGPRAYLQLIASKDVDAVLISSPAYFHPNHLEAVVDAGKHAYCEKPVGVDVHGAKRVRRIGERAQGKVTLHVGFQIRNAPPFVEMVKRIHGGALGKIVCGQMYYYSGALDLKHDGRGISTQEARLRNWMHDRELSGDIVVEQNIHVIDVCNWVLRSHPLKATATGGRKVPGRHGNTWDHYAGTLYYPDDVHVSFGSTQFIDGWSEVCERFFGTKGASESHYSYPVAIYGDEPWDSGLGPQAARSAEEHQQSVLTGQFPGALEHSDSEKQKAFVESITSGRNDNQALQGAESALSGILIRTAAYTREEVTWDELVSSDAKWDPMVNIEKFG